MSLGKLHKQKKYSFSIDLHLTSYNEFNIGLYATGRQVIKVHHIDHDVHHAYIDRGNRLILFKRSCAAYQGLYLVFERKILL